MDVFDQIVVLDGGLATELEARGHDLSGHLWSARLLRDDPAAIEDVHLAFFRAGARVAVTASYQASFEGFAAIGIDGEQTARLIRRSVELARSARDRVDAERADGVARWVAGSVGPYGAMLAGGQEYTGDYGGVGAERLAEFHRPRIAELVAAGADLLAVETIPSIAETAVLVAELAAAGAPAWLSFCCRDGARIADGTSFEQAVALAASCPPVGAVGINCTAVEHVEELLARGREATSLPLVVYPNDGRIWQAGGAGWRGDGEPAFPAAAVRRWRDLGARAIGGCCGVGPSTITEIVAALEPAQL